MKEELKTDPSEKTAESNAQCHPLYRFVYWILCGKFGRSGPTKAGDGESSRGMWKYIKSPLQIKKRTINNPYDTESSWYYKLD